MGVLTGRTLIRFLLLVIFIRLIRDSSARMMYPYLSTFAAGLGITLTAAGALLTVRTIMVLFAPYLGNLADRIGNHPIITIGFLLQAVGLAAMSIVPNIWVAVVAIAMLGLADAFILPPLQAYVSEHSPPQRRGQSLVTVEYSWAISGIIILPILGWLIAEGGWQAPFRILSVFSLIAILVLIFLLPRDVPRQTSKRISLFGQTKSIFRDRSAAGMLVAYASIFVAVEAFFLVWGAHLARDFDLGPAQIGQVAILLGVAELIGAIIASLIIDRMGKRHGVIAGVLVFTAALMFLPWLNRSLIPLLIGLFLVSMAIEYTIVSAIPLMSQQRPTSRATMLAMGAMLAAMSRAFTDSAATWLFENVSFVMTVVYALVALLVALVVLWRWVDERQEV